MSKQQKLSTVAEADIDRTENQQVAPQGEVLPVFLKEYTGPLGRQNIDPADITIPRLKIGQAISDEVRSGAVEEGALFLNVIGDPIWTPGDSPLPVLIIGTSKEYILWNPREDGGGILARAKPVIEKGVKRYKWDKPSKTFEVRIDGTITVKWQTRDYIDEDGLSKWGSEIPGEEDSKPAATEHHNYLVMLPTHNTVAAISLAKTGVKVARDLNATIMMSAEEDDRSKPLCRTKFNVITVDDINDSGDEFKNWRFKPNGFLDLSDPVFAKAFRYFTRFAASGWSVDQESVSTTGGDEEGS